MHKWQKHMLFWFLVYILWTYMKNGQFVTNESWIISLVHLFAYTSIFYLLKKVQIPRLYDQGKMLMFILSLLVSTVGIVFLWYIGMKGISQFVKLHPTTVPRSYGMYILEAIQMFVPGMILLAWESYEAKQEEENRLHMLEKESISNELNYLKAQLNPEFLFSTLESLKTNVKENSHNAPDMILRLSEVLDYILYRSQRAVLPLKEEIEVIKGFIALEKLKHGDKISIEFEVSGNLLVEISPLVLFSHVESSLKENLLKNSSQLDISINIQSKEGQIISDILISRSNSESEIFIDLENIKRQLTLTYPNRHNIRQVENNNAVTTTLILKTAS